MKDSTELEEHLFTWKQKIHESKKIFQELQCQNKIISNETVKYEENIHRFERTNDYLNSILQNARIILESQSSANVKNQDLSKRSVEIKSSEWNELRTRRHKLEDMKTTLEESCNQLRFLKKIQEMKQNQLKRKDIFSKTLYEQDIIKFKEELKMKQQERVKLDKQLSWSKKMLEFSGNKTEKFRQQVEDKKKQLWQIEFALQQDNQFKMDPKL
ncbi:transport and Golgi organization protein 1 homolog [Suncus etruscus]|uniref:transport and Golgi organization protein 1 homolog n=1 Tax=Suncus etruscus TaxID=109475 RepID=UPI00210F8527|nr:transport and Golgi organization protein 1 homolog [Suncus etruscus]XP_049645525.1 transport and Golgi organization protein 1 homolog [Suncus etruscus]XP_049645526.1 transport and Golgi organization protein 1 homolog [Suncus etruscus]XP_049645527.1 transport and Golgi organization protein 1 homolog [Suncus etruscus]XP_049645528.1 transport and Golgi organization protein 1 homolog [Suncus etruscus]